MTAVRYDDVVPAPSAPPPGRTARPRRQPSTGSGNALMDMTTHVLTATLRQLYAALWRAGVIEVTA
ncbi:Rv1535 family protein [Mycobacterium marseillense]|uniref:Uncharacterized protein n=1 Tax=Mycobacterium marseillense TaxID=701042 RepID=A0ABM7JDJ5_9MYCO|nr:Rv1535 family protein [Mycobacterium marseillense]MCA2266466.1 hypothetical protein [Mycobacterium marseillense]MCV7407089.1 hypothetical protein [Mycobacterium marseillense]MDM3977357.1 Rv1535 family protein [Mycobacterium marseillense]OBJ70086.1 hypothetical protein A5626_05255 [Mycobacterium marseillense]ORA87786.1 hypothetical protein BST31_20700 [Mycobacterium marseillense]